MNISIIGASGGIGSALAKQYKDNGHQVNCFSRSGSDHFIDFDQPESIAEAAEKLTQPQDIILVTTGLLHNAEIMPEKSLKELDTNTMQRLFYINTIAPALCAKHFIPKLHTDKKAIFGAISARVGSISDNQIGGWYSYRASKAALNMLLKNTAIETARRYKQMIIMGLHPGTVDSDLSKPFQSYVQPGKLFTPEQSATYLIDILESATPEYSGKVYDWAGKEVVS